MAAGSGITAGFGKMMLESPFIANAVLKYEFLAW